MKKSDFLTNQRGAVVIEMAFVIIGFVLLLTLIVDFGLVMLKQSRLERTNASIISVFRERETLYRENNMLTKFEAEIITQNQVNQLGLLGKTLLGETELSLRIDALYFTDATVQTIDRIETFYYGAKPCAKQIKPLSDYAYLSPYSGLERWMPLYRVTACAPGRMSWYRRIIAPNEPGVEMTNEGLMVSNIAVPR